MLKGVPRILSPELLKILMEMGHGDEIVLADANFPAARVAQRLVRADGHPVPELLDAVLKLFPLDTYIEKPAALMERVPGDTVETPVWDRYREIVERHTGLSDAFEYVERFDFYERASRAYAVVATGEAAQYANLILTKGVIKEEQ
ncbi:L-fucose mutarotase [Paenibacillus thailandensis]|uniref:L-fucose mutarotase n=1 Tax=Paenibacillus thailandensis TaxID=393250 RepID=A0ABW5QVG2_9BACL